MGRDATSLPRDRIRTVRRATPRASVRRIARKLDWGGVVGDVVGGCVVGRDPPALRGRSTMRRPLAGRRRCYCRFGPVAPALPARRACGSGWTHWCQARQPFRRVTPDGPLALAACSCRCFRCGGCGCRSHDPVLSGERYRQPPVWGGLSARLSIGRHRVKIDVETRPAQVVRYPVRRFRMALVSTSLPCGTRTVTSERESQPWRPSRSTFGFRPPPWLLAAQCGAMAELPSLGRRQALGLLAWSQRLFFIESHGRVPV